MGVHWLAASAGRHGPVSGSSRSRPWSPVRDAPHRLHPTSSTTSKPSSPAQPEADEVGGGMAYWIENDFRAGWVHLLERIDGAYAARISV